MTCDPLSTVFLLFLAASPPVAGLLGVLLGFYLAHRSNRSMPPDGRKTRGKDDAGG